MSAQSGTGRDLAPSGGRVRPVGDWARRSVRLNRAWSRPRPFGGRVRPSETWARPLVRLPKCRRVLETGCYHIGMYFFRLKPLKEQLAGPGFTEKERLKYLLVWFIPQVVALFSSRESGDFWALIGGLLLAAIELGGVLYAWRRNGGSEGRSFLDRYLSISWVVSLRTLAIVFGILFVAIQLLGIIGQAESLEDIHPLLPVFSMGLMVGYIALTVGRHIGEVRQSADARLASAPPVSPEQSIERLDKLVESIVHREVETAVRGTRPRRTSAARKKRKTPRRR